MNNPFDRLKSRDPDIHDSAYHSPSYHKYFEGTSETLVTGKNGKGKRIIRVYTGLYYSQDMTGKRRILNRLLFTGLYLGAAALFAFCASLETASNRTWYVTFPEALSFIGLFWMLYVLINYMTAPRDMTVGCYHSTSGPLIKSGRLTAISLGLLTLTQLIYALLSAEENRLSGLLSAAGFAASSAAVYAIGAIDSQITYTRTRSENKAPDHGIEIDQ
jgi:hypothetical protein